MHDVSAQSEQIFAVHNKYVHSHFRRKRRKDREFVVQCNPCGVLKQENGHKLHP